MSRKTLIFGNGLGMALDPAAFALDKAIESVWRSSEIDDDFRSLVVSCLPRGTMSRPSGEDELDRLHVALFACDALQGIAARGVHWLSPHGHAFPAAVRRFIYLAALSFHAPSLRLPTDFVAALARFVRTTKSHVATLNYDRLLYQPLIEAQVLDGYRGTMIDGFTSGGFAAQNLARKDPAALGFYLHLHGSPLFVDRDGVAIKLKQRELLETDDVTSSHIVLAHVRHKPTVIGASSVLREYWRALEVALEESSEVVILGYAGMDEHLNQRVRAARLPTRIVEWDGAGEQLAREEYWRQRVSAQAQVLRVPDVLAFEDW